MKQKEDKMQRLEQWKEENLRIKEEKASMTIKERYRRMLQNDDDIPPPT